jgi:hypothetical protein
MCSSFTGSSLPNQRNVIFILSFLSGRDVGDPACQISLKALKPPSTGTTIPLTKLVVDQHNQIKTSTRSSGSPEQPAPRTTPVHREDSQIARAKRLPLLSTRARVKP